MCDNEYESLEQAVNDVETFQYSHETSTKHVLVQGVYVGSASPLIADIKTQPYSMLTYMDDGMMTGTYDNTHDIPIYSMCAHSGALKRFSSISAEHTIRILIVVYVITFLINLLYF